MRASSKVTAGRIDRLVKVKEKIRALEIKEDELALAIKKAGGGSSKRWLATVARVQKHWKFVKRHKRLVLSRV